MLSVKSIESNRNISFCRAIRPEEKNEYGATIRDAKNYLGIKDLALVMHGSSFPVSDKDLFIGSPINDKAQEVNDFLKMHGFDSIQLGPPGLTKRMPYNSSINSKNYLFTDMQKLTQAPYGEILSDEDIKKHLSQKYIESSEMTDFDAAFDTYDKLFEKAFVNLQTSTGEEAQNLRSEFKTFAEKSGAWLENDAIFEILQKQHHGENFENWPDLAKNLIEYKENPNSQKHEQAKELLNKIQGENKKELDLYKFKQFVLNKQEKEFMKNNPNKLNYISDAIIGFSYRDYWSNQEAFLKGYRVGTFAGGEGVEGKPANQIWDIPVINPKTLFKEDGSLGIGGQLLKQKFAQLLDTYQNVRIDHVMGLIDPWIYKKENIEIEKDASGKVLSTNAHGFFLSEQKLQLDPENKYQQILEKIILPLLKEKGLQVNDAVWESLGYETRAFQEVYYEKLHLPKIVDLKWDRGQNQGKNNWLLISTHDDPPFSQIANDSYFRNNIEWATKPEYLIGFLHPEKTNEQKDELIGRLYWDTKQRITSKYEELLRCGEKIQISFMDFFGLDKTYNVKGTNAKDNWKLRLGKNYQEDYYQRLETQDWQKFALNLPELLKQAVTSKASHNEELETIKPLIQQLEKFKNILQEPENAVLDAVSKTAKTIVREIA